MTDLTPETLAELRRLAESATPGPWASGDPSFGEGNAQCIVSISERAMGRDIQGPNLHPALFDVEFIAAANPAVMLTLLDAVDERDALAAKLDAVREWIDRRGVNVDDRDDDYMRGYRDAQRHARLDANELRALLDTTPETGGES